MKNSKLIALLKSLEKEEAKEFTAFLKWSSQKEKTKCLALYELLMEYHPDFSPQKLKKEEISKKIFPQDAKQHKKLNNLMSMLSGYVEEYLTIQSLQGNTVVKKKLLLEAYENRRLDTLFFRETTKGLDTLEKHPVRDNVYYRKKHEFKQLLYEHPARLTQKANKHTEVFEELVQSYDLSFVIQRVLYAVDRYSSQYSTQTKPETKWEKALISIIKAHPYHKTSPLISYCLKILDLFVENDYTQFHALKKGYTELQDSFSIPNQRYLIKAISNYGLRAYYETYISSEEVFSFQKLRAESGLLIENNYMSKSTFQAMVIYACGAKAFEWANTFTDTYGKYLKDEFRRNTILLSKANILFFQKKYQTALSLLSKADFLDEGDKLNGRMLQLRIYFELNEALSFFSYLTATSQAIRRSSYFSAPFKKAIQHFLKIIKYLFKAKEIRKAHYLEKAEELISHKDKLLYKDWILEKRNELNALYSVPRP